MNYYYQAKLCWKQPKEGTDEMKNHSKQFLIYSHSVTEAEARILNWCPSNYQDCEIKEVKQTPFGEVKIDGPCETFWAIKWLDDDDGRSSKPKPFIIILNALSAEEALQKSKSCSTSFGEIEEVKKYKGIIDEDLISEELPK